MSGWVNRTDKQQFLAILKAGRAARSKKQGAKIADMVRPFYAKLAGFAPETLWRDIGKAREKIEGIHLALAHERDPEDRERLHDEIRSCYEGTLELLRVALVEETAKRRELWRKAIFIPPDMLPDLGADGMSDDDRELLNALTAKDKAGRPRSYDEIAAESFGGAVTGERIRQRAATLAKDYPTFKSFVSVRGRPQRGKRRQPGKIAPRKGASEESDADYIHRATTGKRDDGRDWPDSPRD